MWLDALEHFKKHDPILYRFAQTLEPIVLPTEFKSELFFSHLADSIVGQQLSVKAGNTIWQRVSAILNHTITPQSVLAVEDQLFRDAGMSWSKIAYMKDLAKHVLEEKLDLLTLHTHQNDEIIKLLTQVKGIGPWTVEMFLMFTLGRPDVFSLGDLGLKRGIQKLYDLKDEPTKAELLKFAEKWAPYRTYASRILWKSLDNE
jgi:DNA-3-methyladenine glycosylase II